MLKESSAPMTAYIAGTETIRLGMKIGGDERKDIQRNTVDADEGVPPLADVCQRSRNVTVELRNVVKDKAMEEIGVSLLRTSQASSRWCFATYDGE